MQRQAGGTVSGVRQHRRLSGWWRGSWMARAQHTDGRSATATDVGSRSRGGRRRGPGEGGDAERARADVAAEGRGPPARRGGGAGPAAFGETWLCEAGWSGGCRIAAPRGTGVARAAGTGRVTAGRLVSGPGGVVRRPAGAGGRASGSGGAVRAQAPGTADPVKPRPARGTRVGSVCAFPVAGLAGVRERSHPDRDKAVLGGHDSIRVPGVPASDGGGQDGELAPGGLQDGGVLLLHAEAVPRGAQGTALAGEAPQDGSVAQAAVLGPCGCACCSARSSRGRASRSGRSTSSGTAFAPGRSRGQLAGTGLSGRPAPSAPGGSGASGSAG